MNKTRIRQHLRKKHEEFVDSITDGKIKAIMNNQSIITGGCITSLLLGEKVSDYDYYLDSYEAVTQVAAYFIRQFTALNPDEPKPVLISLPNSVRIMIKSSGQTSDQSYREALQLTNEEMDHQDIMDEQRDKDGNKLNKKYPYRPVFLSSNAITLSNRVQIVTRFFGPPEEIHKNFDFIHTMNYYKPREDKLVLNPSALESTLAKTLVYVGSLYPLCSFIRTRKFVQRGWTINAGQYLKMAFNLSDFDLKNIEVLEDQLIGVDTTYFTQLINQVKADKEAGRLSIDGLYITELINQIFDN
jgi:hypothetical protein